MRQVEHNVDTCGCIYVYEYDPTLPGSASYEQMLLPADDASGLTEIYHRLVRFEQKCPRHEGMDDATAFKAIAREYRTRSALQDFLARSVPAHATPTAIIAGVDGSNYALSIDDQGAVSAHAYTGAECPAFAFTAEGGMLMEADLSLPPWTVGSALKQADGSVQATTDLRALNDAAAKMLAALPCETVPIAIVEIGTL